MGVVMAKGSGGAGRGAGQGAKHPECVTEQDIRECGRLAKQLVSLSTTLSVVLLSAGQSASS